MRASAAAHELTDVLHTHAWLLLVMQVESWQGPWAGFAGEHLAKVSPLEAGTLTAEQQALRKEQGYNPTRPGTYASRGMLKRVQARALGYHAPPARMRPW